MRLFTFAAWTAAALTLAIPLAASRGDTPPPPAPSAEQQQQWQQMREQRRQQRATIFDARVVGFKASLALNPDQEKNWATFEAALRNIASAPRQWGGEHGDKPDGDEPRSPVDLMRSLSQRLGERSAQLTALADATAPLYTSLDDKQKLVFDATLREMWRARHAGGRHRHWD